MNKTIINTALAPSAIGTYSQAVKVGNTLYLSGQIPLLPETMTLCSENVKDQVIQVFKNLAAVLEEAGAAFENIVKLNIYLLDMDNFPIINEVMGEYFSKPYPARAAVGVKALPKNAAVEMDAIAVLDE